MLRLVTNAAAATAELYLYGPIGRFEDYGEISAEDVAERVKEARDSGAKKLDCYLNSPGGDLWEGIAIHNVLRRFDGKKRMQIDAIAASSASVVAMAGDEIEIADNAQIMIHDPETWTYGNEESHQKNMQRLRDAKDTIVVTYMRRAKVDEARVRKMMKDETWMSADTAVQLGFADRRVTVAAVTNCLDARGREILERYRNTPKSVLGPRNDSRHRLEVDKMLMWQQKQSGKAAQT